ncbi:hypothetical protein DFH09DRAFT_1140499 [Mycena vulgaris]|nr:hypothetical protein DFH09DRAFT_1140499 [Mycena vulgaris]
MNVLPVFSLPPEITQQIFRACLPSIGASPAQPLSQQAPVVLTHICRDWRAIALDTPELWQSIAVDTSTGLVGPLMVGLWMSRADPSRPSDHKLPLDISFTTKYTEQGTQYLEESMVYRQQWRDVELRIPMQSFSELIAYHGPFPLLRSLALSMNSGTHTEAHTITIRGAPLLRAVTLTDFPLLTADIPWEQLTTLKLATQGEAAPGIFALQRCPNLVHLEFSLIATGPPPLVIPPFTLPSLQTLLTTGQPIVQYLTLPSLEQLTIWGPGFLGDIQPRTKALRALIKRSACPLERLSLRVPPKMAADAFRPFLQAFAPVIELTLTLYFDSGLQEFVTVLQAPDVLPRLTALRIMDASQAVAFAPLLDTLRARRAPVEGRMMLQSFNLSLEDNARAARAPARAPPSAAMTEFAALADAGLRIRIANGAVLMDR